MTDYYLDSSAILKHYHTEPGSDLVDAMFDGVAGSPIYTAFFSILEVRAAATRLNRGGMISNRGLSTGLQNRVPELPDSPLGVILIGGGGERGACAWPQAEFPNCSLRR